MSAIEKIQGSTKSNKAERLPRNTVARLVLRAIRRWQRNRAITELSRLDDRQLEDIGIARNEIPRVEEGLISLDEADAKPAQSVDYRGETPVIIAESYPRAA